MKTLERLPVATHPMGGMGRTAKLVLACLFLGTVVLVPGTMAGNDLCSTANVNCSNMSGMRTCTASLAGAFTPVLVSQSSTNVTACVFSAMGSDAYFSAMALTSAPSNRICHIVFTRGGGPIECTISVADGLPVELLDFTIEDPNEPSESTD